MFEITFYFYKNVFLNIIYSFILETSPLYNPL
jgi:hypothetical protein